MVFNEPKKAIAPHAEFFFENSGTEPIFNS